VVVVYLIFNSWTSGNYLYSSVELVVANTGSEITANVGIIFSTNYHS
jgi:hypothetical protein